MMRKTVLVIALVSLMVSCSGWSDLCLAEEGIETKSQMGSRELPVSKHKAVFTSPPRRSPSTSYVDAPLLGNGDMGVAIGGAPEGQRFFLAKNDYWCLGGKIGPRVFGVMDVRIPDLAGAQYHVEQSLVDAVTLGTFSKEGLTVRMESWVAATANVLVVRLSSEGGKVAAQVKLPASEESGQDNGIRWIVHKTGGSVETAAAMRLIGADGPEVSIEPGKPVTILLAMASRFKHEDYVAAARKLAGSDPTDLRKAHVAWWRNFWSKSFVELPDRDIERHYYLSNYVMASSSRNPEFPPGIFGVWVTTNNPRWRGDYHLNYNFQAPFYGLYSSNHIEQANPYEAPILAFMERGRRYAKGIGCRGVYYPVGLGPKGTEAIGLFLDQKSNAAYCVPNIATRWYLTYDNAYAKRIYPFVLEVANFWEDYLKFEDGRYVIYNDAVHERNTPKDVNSIVSLGLVRNAFEVAVDMSTALGVDKDRHEKWQHILKNLSGYATQEKDGVTVFRYTEKGLPWWDNNTLGIQHIYPAGAIGLDSDPKLLEISRNMVRVMNRWIDDNGMNSFFPAAVRVGWDPEDVLAKLHDYVTKRTEVNGFALNNSHAIENCSITPNTINEMLCMGHHNILRMFPVWPKDKNARFGTLRAHGAFLVSSSLKNGEVEYVRLLSEQGKTCTMVNPWPGKAVRLYRNDKQAEVLHAAQRFKFDTTPGERIILVPDGTSLEEARRRMQPPK